MAGGGVGAAGRENTELFQLPGKDVEATATQKRSLEGCFC